MLLDLDLPDSGGIATFQQFAAVAQSVPVIVLSSSPDEEAAGAAGAQDYLVRQPGLEQLLPRVVAYALERHRLQAELRDWSLFDELTELFKRRGFFMLAEAAAEALAADEAGLVWCSWWTSTRSSGSTMSGGHAAGDQALMDVAQVLRQAFRGSDIIARLGGDEFVCCAIGASLESAKPLLRRAGGAGAGGQRAERARLDAVVERGPFLVGARQERRRQHCRGGHADVRGEGAQGHGRGLKRAGPQGSGGKRARRGSTSLPATRAGAGARRRGRGRWNAKRMW